MNTVTMEFKKVSKLLAGTLASTEVLLYSLKCKIGFESKSNLSFYAKNSIPMIAKMKIKRKRITANDDILVMVDPMVIRK